MILSYFIVAIFLFEFNNVNSTPVRTQHDENGDMVYLKKKLKAAGLKVKNEEDSAFKGKLKAEGDAEGDTDRNEKQNAGESDAAQEVEKPDATGESDGKEKQNAGKSDEEKEVEKLDTADDSDRKDQQNAEEDTVKEIEKPDAAGDSDANDQQNAGKDDTVKEVEKLDAAGDSDGKDQQNAEDNIVKEKEKPDAASDIDGKNQQNAGESDAVKEVEKLDAAGDSDGKDQQNAGEDDTVKEVEKLDAADDSDEKEQQNTGEDDTVKEVKKLNAAGDSDGKEQQNAGEDDTIKEVEKSDTANDTDGKKTQNSGNDAIIEAGAENSKPIKPPKKESNIPDKSFQKYHAEKVSQMQDTMANNWPLGIIPYDFDTSSFDNILALRVRDAMDFLESASCVQFKAIAGRAPVNYTWIHITNPEKQRECSHKPRRKSSGEIVLILGLDCLRRRDILHSLLHAIGFNDEVTHPNRDQYIRIMWENLQPKYQRLFTVIPEKKKVLVEYDPMSIMHFHDRAFSKNGHATIVPLMPGLQIQPSDKLSQLDKMKLRLAFGHECNRRAVDDLFDTCKNVMHKNSNNDAAEDGVKKVKEEEEQKKEVKQDNDDVKTDSEVEKTRFRKVDFLRNKNSENEVGSAKDENDSRDDSEYDLPKFTII